MPRGISAKREHEYKQLVDKFEDEGRYKDREEEVAARIVNKQRAEQSETQAAKQDDRSGNSPDEGLPLPGYDHLTIAQVTSQLNKMPHHDIQKLHDYEQTHRARKTLLEEYERALKQD